MRRVFYGWVIVAAVCCGPTHDVLTYQPATELDLIACQKTAKQLNHDWLKQGVIGFATCKLTPEYEPP